MTGMNKTGFLLLVVWSFLSVASSLEVLDDRPCCSDCKDHFCPIRNARTKSEANKDLASTASCHRSANENMCVLKSACNHNDKDLLFSFHAILPAVVKDQGSIREFSRPVLMTVPDFPLSDDSTPPPKLLLS